ncbi:MAG: thioredoxin family protein [Aquificaceae bacterium]
MKKALLSLSALMFLVSCEKGTKSTSSDIKDITPKDAYAMLIVESESCIYCKQLKKDLEKPELSAELKGMDVYSILYESNAKVKYVLKGREGVSTEEDLAKALGVNSFPQIFFYDKSGNIILHIPGYQPPKTLACSIRFVKEEKYKQANFMEYIKSKECI